MWHGYGGHWYELRLNTTLENGTTVSSLVHGKPFTISEYPKESKFYPWKKTLAYSAA